MQRSDWKNMASMLSLFAVLLSLLCVSVSAGVPLSKRRAEIEKLNFQDTNEQSVLTIGHRVHVKRQVPENSKEGSVPAEKPTESVDDVAQPSNNKSQDTATGSLSTDAPQVSPAIRETDQSVPPEITTSRLTSDQAPDLDQPTTTESSSTSIKPTSPAPTQNDKDVSLTGLPESEIDKKTTTDPKRSRSSSEHPVTSESPSPKVEVTSSSNDPTSITGVNPSINANNTTQYVTPAILIQPTTITDDPILGELKVSEVTNETPTTNPKSNHTDIVLEAPPPPAENTTKEDTTVKPEVLVDTTAAVANLSTTTTILSTTQGSSENASTPTTTSQDNPVNFEAAENTTSVAGDSTTVTNTQEVIANETTTLLTLVDSTTESSLVNETVKPDVILPSNVSVLESEQDSNLTTVFNDLANITTEPMPINATIIPYLPDVEESNGTVTTSGDVIITNSTEESSTPDILVNATDSNITTTTFPVINETISLPDNVTVAMVTDNPENETVANVTITPPFLSYNKTTGPELTNETLVTDNVTSMENSTYPMTLNITNSTDEEMNVTTPQTIPEFETSSENVTSTDVTNATTTLPTDTTVNTVNLTTAAMTPNTTTGAPNTTTGSPNTTTRAPNTTTRAPNTTIGAPNTTTIVSMTTTLADATTTMDSSKGSANTSASVGQSEGQPEGLSASALTAIITGSIIGFWIILGPIICLVCKVRDKRKDRYHTRLNSQSDPPADNGMVDAMIISELKKNGDSSHDNGNGNGTMKEKEYNTVVNDKAETERLQPNTAEHEF